jgi:hypothetical protein
MSRILKRPMFRKGGEVMEGIMTGIKPRKNYADGKTREEIFAEAISGLTPEAQKYAQSMSQLAGLGRTSNQDLLTNVLIQGGLRGMSTAGKGGTLANLAAAFEAPVGQALKQRQANKMLDIQGAMKGLELGSKVDIAERKALQQKTYESGTDAARIKQMLNLLGGDALSPTDRYKAAQLSKEDIRGQNALGAKYRGIGLPDPKDKTRISFEFLKTQDDGDILLHPFTRKFVVKKSDPIRVEPINQTTFEEITGD